MILHLWKESTLPIIWFYGRFNFSVLRWQIWWYAWQCCKHDTEALGHPSPRSWETAPIQTSVRILRLVYPLPMFRLLCCWYHSRTESRGGRLLQSLRRALESWYPVNQDNNTGLTCSVQYGQLWRRGINSLSKHRNRLFRSSLNLCRIQSIEAQLNFANNNVYISFICTQLCTEH